MVGRGLVAFVALLWLAAPAQAASVLVPKGEAPPLKAWLALCQQNPSECDVDPREPEAVSLTPEVMDLIASVNRHVNKSVAPVTDRERWGVEDVWEYPLAEQGDCEDYQLLKRKLLAEAGLPRRAMRMTVVINELGEGHAVLTVRTDRGDLILDNRTGAILPWHETGYSFIKRESSHRTGWVFVAPDPAPAVVTAAAE
jgi:predicted transglutaminase-like cysteine proteinase